MAAMRGDVDAAREHEIDGDGIGGMRHERTDASRSHRRRGIHGKPVTQQSLRHGAAADVSGADHEDGLQASLTDVSGG